MYNQHINTERLEEVNMSTSDGISKKIPEWSLFERLDELENITLELMDKPDDTEPTLSEIQTTLNDAHNLAQIAVLLALVNTMSLKGKKSINELKGVIFDGAKTLGLSEEGSEWINGTIEMVSK